MRDFLPYKNEYADKTSHFDMVLNPDIQNFLDTCSYMVEPGENDAQFIRDKFVDVPESTRRIPTNIISVDGSYYEASVRDEIPTTKVGYVKIGNVLIKRDMFKALSNGGRFVNPFRVAEISKDTTTHTFVLPSANIRYRDEKDVKDGFRRALDDEFRKLCSIEGDSKTSLRRTLFKLSSYRDGKKQGGLDSIYIHKCPNCELRDIELQEGEDYQNCQNCGNKLFPTDCLRIWEDVGDTASNQTALNRLMNVLEHIFVAHYIRIIVEKNPTSYASVLDNMCFFVDGPLAVFGTPAWIHRCMMAYLEEVNTTMRQSGFSDIKVLGLMKTGYVVDYFKMISKYIEDGKIYCLEDEVRYKYMNYNDNPPKTFGSETYYGQDFLFKTRSGRLFVFNVPYPWGDKHDLDQFNRNKTEIGNYVNIGVYTRLLEDFECDLYENSVVPIALAHKYTAISMEPGSKVLDILSKRIDCQEIWF